MNPVLYDSVTGFLQGLGLASAELPMATGQQNVSLQLETASIVLEECEGRLLLVVVKAVSSHEIMESLERLLKGIHRLQGAVQIQVSLKGENQIMASCQLEAAEASSQQIAGVVDRILRLYQECGVSGEPIDGGYS